MKRLKTQEQSSMTSVKDKDDQYNILKFVKT